MQSIQKIDLLLIEITERLVICKAVRNFQSEAETVRLEKWIKELQEIKKNVKNESL